MSVLIKFRRGMEAGIPTLADGEPGFCMDTYKLYIGSDGTNREILTPNSTALDTRYFTKSQLGDSSDASSSGASLIGVYDDFDNSTSSDLQDVLKDFDTAINQAVSGSGEVNTASNVGTAGVGLFKQKNGVDLEFKKINSGDSYITITDDTANDELDISTNATAANTASAIVARDASGNFTAGTITAALSGNASTATTLQTARDFSISGDATAPAISFDGSNNVALTVTVDKVDGKDVDDNQTSTDYLWTAGKIIDYVDAQANGLDWQNSVLDKDSVTPPTSPSDGDRYIIGANEQAVTSVTSSTKTIVTSADISSSIAAGDTIKYRDGAGYSVQLTVSSVSGTDIVVNEDVDDKTGGTLYHADGDWSTFGPDEVVEYDAGNTTWLNTSSGAGAPNEGWAVWVEDEDKNYVYNGDIWVTFGSTSNHNALSGLQGGTTDEYYHLTSSQQTTLVGWTGSKTQATVLAAPSSANGDASFRSLVASDLPTATTAALGVASFDSDNFTVSSGAVSIADDGIGADEIDFGTTAGQVNTDVLTEGSTNLYFTDARAQAAIDVEDSDSITMDYDSGVIAAEVNVDDDTIKIDTNNSYIYVNSVDGGTWSAPV